MYHFFVLTVNGEEKERLAAMFNAFSEYCRNDFTVRIENYGLSFFENYRPVYDAVFIQTAIDAKTAPPSQLQTLQTQQSQQTLQTQQSQQSSPARSPKSRRHRNLPILYEFRKLDAYTPIVILLDSPESALAGYDVGAVDCFFSDVNQSGFNDCLNRVFRRIDRPSDVDEWKSLTLRVEGMSIKIPVRTIFYVECDGNYLLYHTESQSYRVRGTMKSVEKEFSGMNFLKANKSVIVNSRFIESVRRDSVLLVDGRTVELSRRCAGKFADSFHAIQLARRDAFLNF